MDIVTVHDAADCDQAEAEIRRLTAQLTIAEGALVYIIQIADRGAQAASIGVYAHDVLIQMSVEGVH